MHKPTAHFATRRFFVSQLSAALVVMAFLALPLITQSARAADDDVIRHSFLGVGKANKAVIVGEDGKVQWKFDMPASDGWVLPNGNVLLALYGTKNFPNGGIVEVERESKKRSHCSMTI